MRTVQVKICGLTRLEDATVAADAGADYLGFILYPPSKRNVSLDVLKEISDAMHRRQQRPKLVAVVVNRPVQEVVDILDTCRMDFAQLHGEEVPSQINDPASPLYGRAYKALRPKSIGEAEADGEWFIAESPQILPSILIDAYHPTLKGGTGQLSDWEIARSLVKMTSGLMLAGGLTPDNVAQAVEEVRPYAVDVAGGTESSGGIKDHAKVRAFIENAKSVSLTL